MSRETDRLIRRIGTLLKAHFVTRQYVRQNNSITYRLVCWEQSQGLRAANLVALNDVRAWPWTINADGRGLYLESKAAAIAWVNLQESRHHYIDIGCIRSTCRCIPKPLLRWKMRSIQS